MPRLLSLLMLVCLSFNAHADSYITRLLNKPVPGGVAVIDLGASATAPKATYLNRPVLVVKEQNNWLAIVGIPLTVKPGTERITSGTKNLPFVVGFKKYPEQHITLKNKSQVNPDPAQLKRIEGELAVQLKAYRSFSPNTPSNLLLDKPVNGPLSSKFGVRRFFNGEERNPHSGLDFAVGAGTPIKTPAAGKVILTGNYFFNGNTVFVDHGQVCQHNCAPSKDSAIKMNSQPYNRNKILPIRQTEELLSIFPDCLPSFTPAVRVELMKTSHTLIQLRQHRRPQSVPCQRTTVGLNRSASSPVLSLINAFWQAASIRPYNKDSSDEHAQRPVFQIPRVPDHRHPGPYLAVENHHRGADLVQLRPA